MDGLTDPACSRCGRELTSIGLVRRRVGISDCCAAEHPPGGDRDRDCYAEARPVRRRDPERCGKPAGDERAQAVTARGDEEGGAADPAKHGGRGQALAQ